jgi:hypothetical protein
MPPFLGSNMILAKDICNPKQRNNFAPLIEIESMSGHLHFNTSKKSFDDLPQHAWSNNIFQIFFAYNT